VSFREGLVKGAAVSEEQAQPLTGKARRLANLKLFAKGQLANKTGAGRAGRPPLVKFR